MVYRVSGVAAIQSAPFFSFFRNRLMIACLLNCPGLFQGRLHGSHYSMIELPCVPPAMCCFQRTAAVGNQYRPAFLDCVNPEVIVGAAVSK